MKNYLLTIISLVGIIFVNQVSAFTTLSGEIGDKVLDSTGNPYIIDGELTISQNKKCIVKSGAVFLFKSFSGVKVYGSLFVEGTREQPVTFTSFNVKKYNSKSLQLPNPFDWNGIYISETADGAKFRNFNLSFSVYGIKSNKNDIIIQNGKFKHNGQFHFTIKDNIHYVQDNISYSYNVPVATPIEEKSTKKREKNKKQKIATKNKTNKKSIAISITSSSISAITAVTAVVLGVRASKYQINASLISSDIMLKGQTSEKLSELKKYNDGLIRSKTGMIICAAVSGVTLTVPIIVTIVNKKKDKKSRLKVNLSAGYNSISTDLVLVF